MGGEDGDCAAHAHAGYSLHKGLYAGRGENHSVCASSFCKGGEEIAQSLLTERGLKDGIRAEIEGQLQAFGEPGQPRTRAPR